MPDIIALGEALVEMHAHSDNGFVPAVAGDVFNTLWYAGRLGLSTGLVSALGTDLFTGLLQDALLGEGIDTTHLRHISDRNNGLYFIETDHTGERHFHFWRTGSAATQTLRQADLNALSAYIATARYFLVTGVTLAVMKDDLSALQQLLESLPDTVTVVADTNYRGQLWADSDQYRQAMQDILLPHTHIFLPTNTDLADAWEASPAQAISSITTLRPMQVVMKAGAGGCAVWNGNGFDVHAALSNVQVTDTTGAGDAFNAGFLAGASRGRSVAESCALAQRTAASALGVYGAINQNFKE